MLGKEEKTKTRFICTKAFKITVSIYNNSRRRSLILFKNNIHCNIYMFRIVFKLVCTSPNYEVSIE